MSQLPESVIAAWDKHEGPVVLTTVNSDGTPNSVYATCVSRYGDDLFVVANNYFNKTMSNIQAGGTGSVLFITDEGKAFQVKGPIEYYTEGPVFDDMKTWNPEKHPGHGAAAVRATEIYSGAEKLM